MPIKSAPIGHMSISHRRDNPFIMAVSARHKRRLLTSTVTRHIYIIIKVI